MFNFFLKSPEQILVIGIFFVQRLFAFRFVLLEKLVDVTDGRSASFQSVKQVFNGLFFQHFVPRFRWFSKQLEIQLLVKSEVFLVRTECYAIQPNFICQILQSLVSLAEVLLVKLGVHAVERSLRMLVEHGRHSLRGKVAHVSVMFVPTLVVPLVLSQVILIVFLVRHYDT